MGYMERDKVGIVGHFMYNQENAAVNGQAVKTRNYKSVLMEKYGEGKIAYLDTNYFKKRLFANYYKLWKLCKSCKTVIIMPTQNGLVLLLPVLTILKKLYHFRLLYSVVGGWLPEVVKNNTFIRKLLKVVDRIYPETDELSNELRTVGITNVQTIPNFSVRPRPESLDTVSWMEKPYKLCTFSRVIKTKGIGEAIDAVNALDGYTLDIYGPIDESYRDEFLTRVDGKKIRYCGILNNETIISTLSKYVFMLFPTYYAGEGMPGAVLDGYIAGLPVIASNWHYNAEVVKDGETGFIFELKDIDRLPEIIRHAVEEVDVKALRQNCSVISEQYSPETIMKPIYDVVDSV